MEDTTLNLKKIKHSFSSLISTVQSTDDLQYPFSSLSKIVPADKLLLHEAVLRMRPSSKNYEDSWGYVIQSTRYDGFKWYDPHTGSLIFFGKKSSSDPTLIVATIFAEPEYLGHVVTRVKDALNAPSAILKNVNPEDVEKLTSYGFRQYKQNEGWSKEFRFDDQTFPQQLIDLKKLRDAKGTSYHQLRQTLHKYENNVSFRKYKESDYENVLNLFALKDGNTPENSQRHKGMYYASHVMYPTADLNKFVITDNSSNEIIGFTATSDISSITTTLVASIFKVGVKIESVWGIYQTLMTKYDEGFQLANLGGCETEGTYEFLKRKFQPTEQLKKTHLVYQ